MELRRCSPNVLIHYKAAMLADNQPTINDLLARLYTIRDAAADRLREETGALTTRHAARGMLRSGATLKALIGLIEKACDAALTEMLATLRHMKSVPEIDYQASRDRLFCARATSYPCCAVPPTSTNGSA